MYTLYVVDRIFVMFLAKLSIQRLCVVLLSNCFAVHVVSWFMLLVSRFVLFVLFNCYFAITTCGRFIIKIEIGKYVVFTLNHTHRINGSTLYNKCRKLDNWKKYNWCHKMSNFNGSRFTCNTIQDSADLIRQPMRRMLT